jgi:putative sigma-54 modulation protein
MNVHYTARHTILAPEVKAYGDERFAALALLLGSATEVDVILSVERHVHRAEIHVQARKAGFVVVAEGPDILSALNQAFDGLEKKLKKEREKSRERRRRGGRELRALSGPEEPGETKTRVVRAEHFSAKPMSVEEALSEFELRKKEVFMFRRVETDEWAVLYRRKDGNIGLVRPE